MPPRAAICPRPIRASLARWCYTQVTGPRILPPSGSDRTGFWDTLKDMPRLRLALAQADPTVGDLEGNASLVLAWTAHAAAEGAHVVAFAQLTVEDIAERLAADGLGDIVVLVGGAARYRGQVYNSDVLRIG